MDNQSALFTEKMRSLKNEFEANLPGKIGTISKKWQSLQNKEWDWELFEDIYISIHKLSGTSGTFGLMKISEISSKIENILRRASETKKPLNSHRIMQIDNYIQDLNHYRSETSNNG